ncbi:MAG: 2-oxo acid dehydrogenase subunit E2 [Verrucomicrobia bacterium]|nr:2-oxo acid dehydrogenase subunit E2 [Verrucomicrobiota bacterium]
MDVKLPNLGEGADSGSVVSIAVKVGDTVAQGQILLELENEKAVAPIPSPQAGRVTQIHVKEGQKIAVGQRILTLASREGEEEAPARGRSGPKTAPASKPAPPPPPEPAPSPGAEPPVSEAEPEPSGADGSSHAAAASPAIRKLARELGLDLSKIRGRERGGRIVMEDLRDYIQRLQKLAAAPRPAPAAAAPSGPVRAAPPAVVSIDFAQWGPVARKPMTSLRATISRRMAESWNVIPHVTQFDEADVTRLLELRKRHGAAYEKLGARLTLTPFVLKAVVGALKQFPIFNSSLDEAAGEIVTKEYYHIGIAVDTEAGLIVPVIRDVDRKDLLALSQELQELAEKARLRKIGLEDLKGGTFTVTNQGGIGGAHFTPIINRPEAAILGVGRGALKPVVREGRIEPRTLMPLGLSYDHRLIDGGSAARFIVRIVESLEQFPEADVQIG